MKYTKDEQYTNLFLMAILSFISMYILMYIMVDNYSNVYPNLNQMYMAGIMTIPMIMFELFLMKSMYTNKRLNMIISVFSVIIFLILIICIRKQKLISDGEFLKSMIPHHAAAILMCKESNIQDPELKKLCENIKVTQQSEINFMKSKLETFICSN